MLVRHEGPVREAKLWNGYFLQQPELEGPKIKRGVTDSRQF